ncbi:hypothetical protein ABPG72_001688 [Tetrahymena utriculariae]
MTINFTVVKYFSCNTNLLVTDTSGAAGKDQKKYWGSPKVSSDDEFNQFVKDKNEVPKSLALFKNILRLSKPVNKKLCEDERNKIWKVIKALEPVQVNEVILEGLFSKSDFEQVRNIYKEEFDNILKEYKQSYISLLKVQTDQEKKNEKQNQNIIKFEQNRKKLYDLLRSSEFEVKQFHKYQIQKYRSKVYDDDDYRSPRFPPKFESPTQILQQIGLTSEDLDQQPELLKIILIWQNQFEIDYLDEEAEVNRQYHNNAVGIASGLASSLQSSAAVSGENIVFLLIAAIAAPFFVVSNVFDSIKNFFFG